MPAPLRLRPSILRWAYQSGSVTHAEILIGEGARFGGNDGVYDVGGPSACQEAN